MANESEKTSAKTTVSKKATAPRTAVEKKTTARKKTAAKKRPPAQKATPGKRVGAKKAPSASNEAATRAVRNVYTQEQRHKMIATMAYFLAEKRGFAPGNSEKDWLQSERIIDDLLKKQGIRLTE